MSGEFQVIASTELALAPPGGDHLLPALILREGDRAGWRYVEFFTANIRNPNTRRAYARGALGSSPGATTMA